MKKPVQLMFLMLLVGVGLVLGCAGEAPVPVEAPPEASAPVTTEPSPAEQAAMQALDDFMEAFNSKDSARWAATLQYPHVRFASGAVRTWQDASEAEAAMDFDAFAERIGWDHSAWDEREAFQVGDDKVHVAVVFSRYDADGNKISTYESLYIVTRQGDRWGTQSRSSFAP